MLRFRLFIAGDAPSSVRARRNLQLALDCLAAEGRQIAIDVVDVLQDQRVAINDGVSMVPTLLRCVGSKRVLLVGDLDDRGALLAYLRNDAGAGNDNLSVP